MDLGAIAEAVADVGSRITDIPDTSVFWVNTAGASDWAEFPQLELVSKGPRRARAWDWVEKEYDSGTGKVIRSQVGPREMLITFRVEHTDQTPGQSAEQIVSNIQTRLQRASIQKVLQAAGLAVATISDMVIADYPIDDRMNSVAQIDVLFNLAEVDVDTDDSGDWFNIVQLRSNKLHNPDGTDATTQIDLTVGPP